MWVKRLFAQGVRSDHHPFRVNEWKKIRLVQSGAVFIHPKCKSTWVDKGCGHYRWMNNSHGWPTNECSGGSRSGRRLSFGCCGDWWRSKHGARISKSALPMWAHIINGYVVTTKFLLDFLRVLALSLCYSFFQGPVSLFGILFWFWI